MGERYKRVEDFEAGLYDWTRGLFLEERLIFAEMAELMLAPVEHLPFKTEGLEGDKKAVVLMLISRMFNDFESAKLLILNGLCEQAYMPLRDTVECMMLIRLFNAEPERAVRWVSRLAEYSPGGVRKRLEELKIEAPEYALYSPLSRLSHANLLGSLTHVQEVNLGDRNLLRTYHFGGFRNEKWIARELQFALIHMIFALVGPLGQTYWLHLPDPHKWYEDVMALMPRLQKCGVDTEAMWPEMPTRHERDAEYERTRRQVVAKLSVNFNYFNMDEINKHE